VLTGSDLVPGSSVVVCVSVTLSSLVVLAFGA